MPELPEAEVARRSLAPLLTGRRIAGVEVPMPTRIRKPAKDGAAFASALRGRVIMGVERRGKGLLLPLDDGMVLELSLGLWSSLTWRARRPGPGETRRVGLVLELEVAAGQGFLVMADVVFAGWGVGPYEPPPGPPPWDALDGPPSASELERLAAARRGRRAGELKALLTDERAILGVGNGGADEMLWRAGLAPRRRASSLTVDEWRRLLAAVSEELTAAIAAGGEEGFLDAAGRAGTHRRRIHHHGGEPCPRCGTPLGSLAVGGRETNWCPVCQPEVEAAR